jgi:hypothetical protein
MKRAWSVGPTIQVFIAVVVLLRHLARHGYRLRFGLFFYLVASDRRGRVRRELLFLRFFIAAVTERFLLLC